MQAFFENVKGNEEILLKKWKRKTSIRLLLKEVYIMVRVLGKFPGAFFEKYNDVYIFYIPVGKFLFLLLAPYSFVLAQEKIRSIAGAPLAGKGVAQPWNMVFCFWFAWISSSSSYLAGDKGEICAYPLFRK